jgi:Spy/CpxP family protein refolding chaperone
MKRTKRMTMMLAAACLAVVPLGSAIADEPVDPSPVLQAEDRDPDSGMAWIDDDLGAPGAFHGGPNGGEARMPHRMGAGRGWHGMGRGFAFAGLDLTEAQRKKLAEIHDAQNRSSIQARANLEIAQLDLRKLIRADKPDQKAINAQIDRIGTMRSSLQKSRIGSMLEARAVLTPEQQKQLRERGERGGRSGSQHSDRTEDSQ